ncbi:hypothetical protein [Lentibacillus cibarius]|nr:hypothetical protein [Lentibacillus cibarius]
MTVEKKKHPFTLENKGMLFCTYSYQRYYDPACWWLDLVILIGPLLKV